MTTQCLLLAPARHTSRDQHIIVKFHKIDLGLRARRRIDLIEFESHWHGQDALSIHARHTCAALLGAVPLRQLGAGARIREGLALSDHALSVGAHSA